MAIDMIILHDNGYVEQVDANGVGRPADMEPVAYTPLRAHETGRKHVRRLLLKKKQKRP